MSGDGVGVSWLSGCRLCGLMSVGGLGSSGEASHLHCAGYFRSDLLGPTTSMTFRFLNGFTSLELGKPAGCRLYPVWVPGQDVPALNSRRDSLLRWTPCPDV